MRIEPSLRLPVVWSGVSGRFALHLFQGALSLADMDRLEALGVAWHASSPGQMVEMSIIYPSPSRLSDAERARLVQIIKRWDHQRIASATVILAEGIIGAIHRSVLTGIMLIAPPPHPAKIFSKTAPAVTWLEPHVRALGSPAIFGADLQHAVDAMCNEFEARPRS